VRRLFFAVLTYFLTPAGVVVMGLLDARATRPHERRSRHVPASS
jgi:hypothetical protein